MKIETCRHRTVLCKSVWFPSSACSKAMLYWTIGTFKVHVSVSVQVDVSQDVLQVSVSNLKESVCEEGVNVWGLKIRFGQTPWVTESSREEERLSQQLCTCCPKSFFIASLSSAVLICPSPLVSNWKREKRRQVQHGSVSLYTPLINTVSVAH